MISKTDGRVHTDYRQAWAVTGRLSSNNPNLQNIPIRTEKGRSIRKAFIARNNDFLFMSADYSQIELRIAASFAKDEIMIEAFRNKRDIHTTTAAKVFQSRTCECHTGHETQSKGSELRNSCTEVQRLDWRKIWESPEQKRRKSFNPISPNLLRSNDTWMIPSTTPAKKNTSKPFSEEEDIFVISIPRNVTTRGFAERNAINAPIQGVQQTSSKLRWSTFIGGLQKRN